jgi:ectoine hydroxylase-related dioxygenase (phytanoyl-CoA dioxygenase family)
MSGQQEAVSPSAQDLRGALERDGYLIFDPGIDEATIDGAVADVQALFRDESRVESTVRRARRALGGRSKTISHRDANRVGDAWVASDNVKEIALAPRVIELLRVAYEREPRPFQTLNFRLGSEQRPHSDAMHFNSDPSGFMCGVWMALEDIGPEQGPLVYYPGSHKLDEVTMGDVHASEAAAGNYEDFVQAVIDREGLEPQTATLRKGEALLWSSNLLHGGSPHGDRALTRSSQVTHYFFEGTRYWKPLASDASERHYWDPTWIR